MSKLLKTKRIDHKPEVYCPRRKKIKQTSKKKSVKFGNFFPK